MERQVRRDFVYLTEPLADKYLCTCSNEWVVEPGMFNIFVGTSEEVYLNTTLTVQGTYNPLQ